MKEDNLKQIIDEAIENMTIEELKAAAKVGLAITLNMMSKTIEAIKEHLLKKGSPGG